MEYIVSGHEGEMMQPEPGKDAGKNHREVNLLFINAACLTRQTVTRMIRQMLLIKEL